MSETAVLVLRKVRVNGRPALVSVFEDRLSVTLDAGERSILITQVARVTTKGGLRTGRVGVALVDGEELVIRGLRTRDARVAHATIVRLAARADP